MIKRNIQYFLIVFSVLISCQNEDLPEELVKPVNRTIIVYMAADNDLSADAIGDIEEMKQGFSETGANLVVFIDPLNEPPCLLEIHQDREILIKSYPELNSVDPDVCNQVLREIIDLYPAKEYGLILWSHGTSWMPTGVSLRSFGQDSGKEMNLVDLAKILPVHFRFILFDACLMGSVEVVYELRNCTDYIIASSTETIADGFPYHRILPELIKPNPYWTKVAQEYFNYYNNQQGVYRSATVSVINTAELEALAYEMKQLFEKFVLTETFNRVNIQRLDVYEEQYHFDLLDFVNKAFPDADKNAFLEQLKRTVLYKNATPMFLSEYEINSYCGLSCYIPHLQRNDLNEYYKTLKWYSDAGIDKLNTGQDKVSEIPPPETVLPP